MTSLLDLPLETLDEIIRTALVFSNALQRRLPPLLQEIPSTRNLHAGAILYTCRLLATRYAAFFYQHNTFCLLELQNHKQLNRTVDSWSNLTNEDKAEALGIPIRHLSDLRSVVIHIDPVWLNPSSSLRWLAAMAPNVEHVMLRASGQDSYDSRAGALHEDLMHSFYGDLFRALRQLRFVGFARYENREAPYGREKHELLARTADVDGLVKQSVEGRRVTVRANLDGARLMWHEGSDFYEQCFERIGWAGPDSHVASPLDEFRFVMWLNTEKSKLHMPNTLQTCRDLVARIKESYETKPRCVDVAARTYYARVYQYIAEKKATSKSHWTTLVMDAFD